MAENSGIGWTDHTMNFWWGCVKVSLECSFCYIASFMKWVGKEPFNGPLRTKDWSKPHRWNRKAAITGERPRIFTCSMSDFFHPDADEWRDEAWDIIRECKNLDWLILTKRPELILDQLLNDWGNGWDHVRLGVTCGVQRSLNRIPLIQKIPAKVRFISAEPLLEQIDFTPHLDGSIHWVITGCEKAAKNKRRPMDIEWVRDIDRQCRDADVAHFFKQRYEGAQIVTDGLLDGVVRHEWPKL